MSKAFGQFRFAAILAINSLGVVAIIGILFALLTGNDYHQLVVLAAFIYLLFRPLLFWMSGRTKKQTSQGGRKD